METFKYYAHVKLNIHPIIAYDREVKKQQVSEYPVQEEKGISLYLSEAEFHKTQAYYQSFYSLESPNS